MYLKVFLPFIIFLIFQIFNYFFYGGYNLNPSLYTNIIVFLMYMGCLAAVLIFCISDKSKKQSVQVISEKSNTKTEIFMIFLALVFLLKPTILLFAMGFELGFGYLRENYFTDPSIQRMIYGSNIMVAITNYYINPFLWFYLILICNYKNKRTNYVFYTLMFFLVLFNLSYGGRFNIYYAIFILYLKNILEGNSFFHFCKKYFLVIFLLIFMSFVMLYERNENNQRVLETMWLGLYEYHNLPTFLLAQKIDNGDLLWEGFIFKTPLYSFLSPIYMIFGERGDVIPYFYYSVIFNEFTLYSFYTNNYYNSYATFFAYFYSDNGSFAPLVIFCYIFILLFYSKIIDNFDIRLKYLSFIGFALYNSLFMAPIFNPGYVLIIWLFPILYLFFKKFKGVK